MTSHDQPQPVSAWSLTSPTRSPKSKPTPFDPQGATQQISGQNGAGLYEAPAAFESRPFVVSAVQPKQAAGSEVAGSMAQRSSLEEGLRSQENSAKLTDLTRINLFAGATAAPPPSPANQRTSTIEKQPPLTNLDVQRQDDSESDEWESGIQRKCTDCAAEDGDDESNPLIQTKLTVGQPDDLYEQEADRVAAKVVSMPEPAVQRSVSPLSSFMRANQVQRKGGSSNASAGFEQQLKGTKGSGAALGGKVRGFMEPRFGADFSQVRVHTDSTAVQMNKEVGAQAFAHGNDLYFNAGKYSPDSTAGKELLAHELTHTIQQTGCKQFQPKLNRKPSLAADEPVRAKTIANNIVPLKLKALQHKADEDETLQAKQLDAEVLEQQEDNQLDTSLSKSEQSIQPKAISALGSVTAANKPLLLRKEADEAEAREEESETQPIQAKSINSLPEHRISQDSHSVDGKLIQQKVAISSAPVGVQRAGGASWIMRKVGGLLRKLPGFGLLSTLLGKNPVTGETVERNATGVIGGILKLIGKEDLFQKLKESNAIEKAFAWFGKQIAKLNLTWPVIRGLFSKGWDSLSRWDLLSPVKAFNKIATIFSAPIKRIRNFAFSVVGKVGEFIFEGAMKLAGGAGQRVMGILKQAGGVIGNIIKNPVGFVGNLVKAVKGGFQKFSANIGTHLKTGLMGWLFGALAGTGLVLPQTFNLKGIIDVALQVVGATYQDLRQLLIEKVGEKRVAKLEKAFAFVKTLATDGLAGAWQKIMEFAGNLQEMVFGGIKNWVMKSVVGAAITKLVTIFNPAGALIQAAMSIYNTIMFFVERSKQIAALANSVFSSIGKIASGNVGAAVGFIEQSMAQTLPVVISFLARQVGLGDIAGEIKGIIGRVRGVIQGAIGKLVNFVVSRGKSLLGMNSKSDRSALGNQQSAKAVKKHETLADEVVSKLRQTDKAPKDYKSLKLAKKGEARELEKTYTSMLEPGIKLTVQFEDDSTDRKDGDIDFKVVIAPNTTTRNGSVGPTKPTDWTIGTPASTLISAGSQVSGHFPLFGASPNEVRYRMNGSLYTSYIVYDNNGRAIKRVDVTGRAHGGVPTPHVVEYKHNTNPQGQIFVQPEKTVRPARTDEVP